ncbi:MAG: hypothetical protein ACI8UO_002167 [Verrucomicrobiales bacterium]|jgi:hypothetical protein
MLSLRWVGMARTFGSVPGRWVVHKTHRGIAFLNFDFVNLFFELILTLRQLQIGI